MSDKQIQILKKYINKTLINENIQHLSFKAI